MGGDDDSPTPDALEVRPRISDWVYGPIFLCSAAYLALTGFDPSSTDPVVALVATYSTYPVVFGQRWFRLRGGEFLIGRRSRVIARFDVESVEAIGGDWGFRSYVWVRFRGGRMVFLGTGGEGMSELVQRLVENVPPPAKSPRSSPDDVITIASPPFDPGVCVRCGAKATRAVRITARAGLYLIVDSFGASKKIDVPACSRCASRSVAITLAVYGPPILAIIVAFAGAFSGHPLVRSDRALLWAAGIVVGWLLVAGNFGAKVIDRLGTGVWIRRWSDDRLRARLGFSNEAVRRRAMGRPASRSRRAREG